MMAGQHWSSRSKERYYPLGQVAPELVASTPERGLMNLFNDWARAEARLAAIADEVGEGSYAPALPPPRTEDLIQ
jgi:hypothetical protein